MSPLVVRTPSRLHFGLLSWGHHGPRRFGSVGLMIEDPGLRLRLDVSSRFEAQGPGAGRAFELATVVADRLRSRGIAVPPASLVIEQAPPEHVGLGSGTQLALAVARALTRRVGLELSPIELAGLTGRGLRSGVGIHGFESGGLIVDGGHRTAEEDIRVAPLISRLAFPDDWSILLVIPGRTPSVHGPQERAAFAALPAFPDSLTDRLCRLVLLDMLPAVAERDLAGFGAALSELQDRVGTAFAPAQGGIYARPELEGIVACLRANGLHGVGQSSWGPTLYGFTTNDHERNERLRLSILRATGLPPGDVTWTRAAAIAPSHARP